MVCQFLVGGLLLVSVVGLVLLLCKKIQKQATTFSSKKDRKEECNLISSDEGSTHDSETDDKISADIIIVGAGVVGSALAYTLGKVVTLKMHCFASLQSIWE